MADFCYRHFDLNREEAHNRQIMLWLFCDELSDEGGQGERFASGMVARLLTGKVR